MPIYNVYDDDQCRAVVDGFYESAQSSYDYASKEEAEMNDQMNQLIYKQDQYGVNLAGNNDFCIWAHNDRYGMNMEVESAVSEKDAKLPAPVKECLWPEALSEFSKPTNEPIRSV